MRPPLLLATLLNLLPATALACSCAPPVGELQSQVKRALGKADIVVLARALSSAQWEAVGEAMSPPTQSLTQFEPLKDWKGVPAGAIEVLTYADPSMCGKTFIEGIEYLIYLYGPDENGFYQTNSCSRTNRAKNAQEEMKILDEASSSYRITQDGLGTYKP